MIVEVKTLWITIDSLGKLFGNEGMWFANRLRSFCGEGVQCERIVIPVVATIGIEDRFAAYIGFPEPKYLKMEHLAYSSQGKHTFDGCKRFGNKISAILAKDLFPQLKDREYR